MKKFTYYFFLMSLLSATVAMASNVSGKKNQIGRNNLPNGVLTVPFYEEQFASGIPATWQNIDNNSPNGILWRHTTTGAFNSFPFDGFLSATGTSAANGYMILDSDSANGVGGEDASLITDAIDCSSRTNVHLTFNQYFAQYNVSIGIVWVSNDGATWNDVHHAEAGLGSGSTTANPYAVDIDISSIAAGQATVYIQFQWIGDFEYFWMVDDVALYEVAAADGGVLNILSPLSTCASLTSTEQIVVEIKNYGATDLSGFDVSYVLNGGAPVPETVSDTIAPGDTLVYTFAATADLSAPGAHNILAYTTVISDADVANDQFAASLYNGPHMVYQGSDYTQGFEVLTGEDISGWATLDVNTDNVIWGLSGTLPRTGAVCADFSHELPTNAADDWIFSTCIGLSDSNIYQLDFYYRIFSPAYQANMEVHLCTAQDPASSVQTLVPMGAVSNSFYQMSSSTIYIQTAGTYYIGWHVTNQDSSTSLKIDDINLHYTGPNQVIQNAYPGLKLYPNPSTGIMQVAGLRGETEITVLDMLGNEVINQVSVERAVLDLSGFANGIYTVRLTSGSDAVTRKVVIHN